MDLFCESGMSSKRLLIKFVRMRFVALSVVVKEYF
jgi:hypothetical protein